MLFRSTIGRKPIILIGVGLFLIGSILCGFAWNMTSLIVFRIIQGLGAGAVAPMSMTIIGDFAVRGGTAGTVTARYNDGKSEGKSQKAEVRSQKAE